MAVPTSFLSHKSRYVENLMRHRFVYEVSRLLLLREEPLIVSVSQAEVDDSGIDLVMTCGRVVRHLQLKTRASDDSGNTYDIAETLSGMPGAGVLWICYDRETFSPTHYYLFGGRGNAPLDSLLDMHVAERKKGGERKGYRQVKMSDAQHKKRTLIELVEILFDLRPFGERLRNLSFASLP